MFKRALLLQCLDVKRGVTLHIHRNYGVVSTSVRITQFGHCSFNNYCVGMNLKSHSVCNNIGQKLFSTESLAAMNSKIFTFLSENPVTDSFKTYVISVHEITGLPWWGTVIFSTFLLRIFLTLPLAIYQARIIAKVENISLLEMPEKAREVQKETAIKAKQLGWPESKAKFYYKHTLKKEWNTLIIRDNCHPLKATLTVWFQLPTWIFFSAALRNLAYMLPYKTAEAQILYMNLAVGGFLWIPNLTQPDGLLILPVLLGLSNLAIIEIQAMMRLRQPTRLQRYASNFFRCFSIALVPISATVPSIVCLYWTSSSVIGLCQNLLLMSNEVKRVCRIPDTPTTLDHPYKQLIHEIKEKSYVPNWFKKN